MILVEVAIYSGAATFAKGAVSGATGTLGIVDGFASYGYVPECDEKAISSLIYTPGKERDYVEVI